MATERELLRQRVDVLTQLVGAQDQVIDGLQRRGRVSSELLEAVAFLKVQLESLSFVATLASPPMPGSPHVDIKSSLPSLGEPDLSGTPSSSSSSAPTGPSSSSPAGPPTIPLLTASIDPLAVDANIYIPAELTDSFTDGIVGLQNAGNTCFINSTIQSLMSCELFRNRSLSIPLCSDVTAEPVTSRTLKFSRLFWVKHPGTRPGIQVLPTSAWVQVLPPWLGGYRQQDAQEFLIWYLDSLREEAKVVIKKMALPDTRMDVRARQGASHILSTTQNHSLRVTRLFADTWVDEIFASLCLSAVTCQRCNTVTEKFESNYMLSLQLPLAQLGLPIACTRSTPAIRLESCLAAYFESESIDEFACLNCTLVDRVVRATDFAMSRAVDILPTTDPHLLLKNAEALLSRCHASNIARLEAQVSALLGLPSDSTDKHALFQLQDTLGHTNNKLERLTKTIAQAKSGQPFPTGVIVQLVRSLEDLEIELGVIAEIVECTHANALGESTTKSPQLLKQPASRKLYIQHQPSVLILHIKRFHITLHSSTKLQHVINFATDLDIGPYMSGDFYAALSAGKTLPSTRYRLCAVIEHMGQLNSGHYVAYVQKASGWYRCSDSTVSKTDLDRVLRSDAYILWYQRY